MDHVHNNPSMAGDQTYSHQVGHQINDYALDTSLIDESQWQQSAGNYSHQDVFAPQQAYQQYGQPAQPPFNYGVSQSSVYPNASYASIYGQQAHPSNNGGPYGAQFGGLPNSAQGILSQTPLHHQSPPQAQQAFTTNQNRFQYSSQGSAPATISPHDLERAIPYPVPSRNSSAPQSIIANSVNPLYERNWNPELQIQERQATHLAFPYATSGSENSLVEPNPPNREAVVPPPSSSQPTPKLPENSSSQTRAATQENGLGQLRITHAGLLAETENTPARRIPKAPYAILGAKPIELDNKYASKALPVWQIRPNRSGKILVPGLEKKLIGLSTTTPSKLNKARSPRVKKYKSTIDAMKRQQAKAVSARSPSAADQISLSASATPEESSTTEYTSSEEESEYSDDEEELGDMRTLEEFRPEPRPKDVAGAARWDALGVIYSPAGRRPTPEEKVKVATEFPLLIGTLREELVKVNTDLAKAETEKRDADAKKLKDERSARQQALVNALGTVITTAHQDIRDTLATVDRFVVGLTNILRMCVKAEDYLGDLAITTFELMAKFTKASENVLTKSKFDVIVKKFNKNRAENKDAEKEDKRKQEDIRRFIETISKNTVEAQNRAMMKASETPIKKEEHKDAPSPKPAEKESKATSSVTSKPGTPPISGIKRPRESDGVNNISNKKVASEGMKNAVSKAPAKSIPLKPTQFFSRLAKQPPKPAASSTSATLPVKAAVKKPAPAAPQPSVLGAILASIHEKKEEPKLPEAPQRPAETAEQKAKRERKESRRHLRVRFREGEDLTEVRLFRHEQAEDEGRQGDMLRDAHDDRSEGMMHKQRVKEASAMDEDDAEIEINEKPWPEPGSIDFSVLGEDILERNFTTRGGRVTFKTLEQQIQDRHEQTELMIVYADDGDIPLSSKEPPFEQYIPNAEKLVGQPSDAFVQLRLREIHLYGVDAAVASSLRLLDEERFGKLGQTRQLSNSLQPSSGTPDVSSILKSIQSISPQQNLQLPNFQQPIPSTDVTSLLNAMKKISMPQDQQAHPQGVPPQNTLQQQLASIMQSTTANANANPPTVQPEGQLPQYCPPRMDPVAMANLYRVFDLKKGLPFPATEPPEWMGPASRAEWYEGVARDKAAKEAVKAVADAEAKQKAQEDQAAALLRFQQSLATQQQMPQYNQPPMSFLQIPGFSVPALPNMGGAAAPAYDPSQLQDILAGLGYGQNVLQPQQQQQAQYPTTWPPQHDTNYMVQNPYQPSYGQQSQQPSWLGDFKDGYKDDENTRYGQDTSKEGKKHWDGGDKRDKKQRDPDYKRGTKPCKFWQEGKCAKGANCTFIHD